MTWTDTGENLARASGMPHELGLRSLVEPRAAALCLLAIYLTASGLMLAIGGHGALTALHAAAVLMIGWALVSPARAPRAAGDLLPLIAAPLLYGEIPWLIAVVGTSYHDVLIQHWEVALFRSEPSRLIAVALPVLGVSELLHLGYLAYYPAIFAPPLLLYVRRVRRAFAETVLALTTTYLLCWVLFVLMPVEGPRYLWGAPPGVPDGPVRRLAVSILAAGSSRGAAFPSSHMAVMACQTVMALRWQRPFGYVLAVVSVLVGAGAVYGGFHYAVDIIAGATLGAACAAAILRRFRVK
jgi:membrane-associated phospholipid phosphatase